MYWVEQLERLIKRTFTDDTDSRAYVAERCYPGELVELPNPKYPLICFKVIPEVGDMGYLKGKVKFWFWCEAGDTRIYTIFEKFKNLFHNQRLSFTDSTDRTVHVVFKVGEPLHNVETAFGAQVLLSTTVFQGIET